MGYHEPEPHLYSFEFQRWRLASQIGLWDVNDLRSTVGVIRAEGGKRSVIVASLNEHDYAFLGQPFPLVQLHGRCARNEATAVGQNRTGNFSWARLAGVQTLRFRQSSLGGQSEYLFRWPKR